ncbi:hypothetical protein AVEN_115272-1 [Araneus ventricosus]|uniref:Uncharacterized protein n=1 Tax=Araneus ventricosus TaxID=182803 RepID=A0A4Y1ZZR5_ARAVE|nr:hypothetical protein AVEN_115272-1 [Araneus ventricosus]
MNHDKEKVLQLLTVKATLEYISLKMEPTLGAVYEAQSLTPRKNLNINVREIESPLLIQKVELPCKIVIWIQMNSEPSITDPSGYHSSLTC